MAETRERRFPNPPYLGRANNDSTSQGALSDDSLTLLAESYRRLLTGREAPRTTKALDLTHGLLSVKDGQVAVEVPFRKVRAHGACLGCGDRPATRAICENTSQFDAFLKNTSLRGARMRLLLAHAERRAALQLARCLTTCPGPMRCRAPKPSWDKGAMARLSPSSSRKGALGQSALGRLRTLPRHVESVTSTACPCALPPNARRNSCESPAHQRRCAFGDPLAGNRPHDTTTVIPFGFADHGRLSREQDAWIKPGNMSTLHAHGMFRNALWLGLRWLIWI